MEPKLDIVAGIVRVECFAWVERQQHLPHEGDTD
jgi:hypothetical protein